MTSFEHFADKNDNTKHFVAALILQNFGDLQHDFKNTSGRAPRRRNKGGYSG
jgi:hypothetical protein